MSTRKVDAGQKPLDIMACHVTGRSGRRQVLIMNSFSVWYREGRVGFERALARQYTKAPGFHQALNGRWRKATQRGVPGGANWHQEMAIRAVMQNPALRPTPELCKFTAHPRWLSISPHPALHATPACPLYSATPDRFV